MYTDVVRVTEGLRQQAAWDQGVLGLPDDLVSLSNAQRHHSGPSFPCECVTKSSQNEDILVNSDSDSDSDSVSRLSFQPNLTTPTEMNLT